MAQQKRENYFETNIRDVGENFLRSRSAQDIQKDAKKRIFKDMIYGNIDYAVYGTYFQDPNFVDNLITVAHAESIKHTVEANALWQYHISTGDAVALQLYTQHYNVSYILQWIYYDLEMVKNTNYDISYLTAFTSQIGNIGQQGKKDYAEFY